MSVTNFEPDYTCDFKPLHIKDDPELTPMYSFNDPSAMFWHGVAHYLHRSGLDDAAIREALASKDARWMMDGYGTEIAELGASVAERFYSKRQ